MNRAEAALVMSSLGFLFRLESQVEDLHHPIPDWTRIGCGSRKGEASRDSITAGTYSVF